MEKKRIECIDIAKGIAIFTVCSNHIGFQTNFTNTLVSIFPFLMGMFFMLSGYFYKPDKGYWFNFKKRVNQILKPFLIYGAVIIFAYWLFETIRGNSFEFIECLKTYGRMAIDANAFQGYDAMGGYESMAAIMVLPLWFLSRMFFSELIFFAVADFALKTWKNACTVVFSLVGITFVLQTFVPVHLIFQLEICFAIAALMVIAAFAKKYNLAVYIETGYKKLKYWLILAVDMAIYVALLLLTNARGIDLARGNYSDDAVFQTWKVFPWFVISIAGTYWILVLCTFIAKIKPLGFICKQLGTRSLTVLSFHLIFGYIISRIAGFKTILQDDIAMPKDTFEYIVSMAFAIIGCILLDMLINYGKKKLSFVKGDKLRTAD